MPQEVVQLSGMRRGRRCKICRCMSSTKAKLNEQQCKGTVVKKWENLAAVAAAAAKKDTDGHTRVYSGEVVWCSTCGEYADREKGPRREMMQRANMSMVVCGASFGS